MSEARYEGRIFEFGKPNKLNQLSQLIQPNKRSELNDPNALNDINELNDPNELNDHNHLNLSHEIYAVTAQRISSGRTKRIQRSQQGAET